MSNFFRGRPEGSSRAHRYPGHGRRREDPINPARLEILVNDIHFPTFHRWQWFETLIPRSVFRQRPVGRSRRPYKAFRSACGSLRHVGLSCLPAHGRSPRSAASGRLHHPNGTNDGMLETLCLHSVSICLNSHADGRLFSMPSSARYCSDKAPQSTGPRLACIATRARQTRRRKPLRPGTGPGTHRRLITCGRSSGRCSRGRRKELMTPENLTQRWRSHLFRILERPEVGKPLQSAALAGKLATWTSELTSAVVETCAAMGWRAAAKGYLGQVLPVARREYLALDVVAFADSPARGRSRSPSSSWRTARSMTWSAMRSGKSSASARRHGSSSRTVAMAKQASR